MKLFFSNINASFAFWIFLSFTNNCGKLSFLFICLFICLCVCVNFQMLHYYSSRSMRKHLFLYVLCFLVFIFIVYYVTFVYMFFFYFVFFCVLFIFFCRAKCSGNNFSFKSESEWVNVSESYTCFFGGKKEKLSFLSAFYYNTKKWVYIFKRLNLNLKVLISFW